jgi:signal transduction histidine kinase
MQRSVVLGNESQLSRMVGNLVDNALRYARSEVELSVTVSDRWAVIRVTDDGPGIPEADSERVWDRFVRLDDDRSQASGGSGLGLAIVRELAVAHGGTTAVRDRSPGPGAEFVIRLPLLAGEDETRDTARLGSSRCRFLTVAMHAGELRVPVVTPHADTVPVLTAREDGS